MKKLILISLFSLFFTLSYAQSDPEKEAIKAAIVQTYAKPLYEGGSLEAIKKGLHEDFEMFVYIREEFSKRSKAQWLGKLEEVRNRPKSSNSPKRVNTYEFATIDYTGPTAMVKLKVFRDGKLNYTDYLTLYKIEGTWKLLSKFFTWHGTD